MKHSPKWEILLDVDALGANEGQSWVWQARTANHDPPPLFRRGVGVHTCALAYVNTCWCMCTLVYVRSCPCSWGQGSIPEDRGPGIAAQRCMVQLSPGGSDAVEMREYDVVEKVCVCVCVCVLMCVCVC